MKFQVEILTLTNVSKFPEYRNMDFRSLAKMLKIFLRKINMARILSIVIADTRNRVWHLKKKKKMQMLPIFG